MTHRSEQLACSVCGMGGYWVAYDPTTDSVRCVNHIGSTPESLQYQDRTLPLRVTLGPDCLEGKHRACSGDAWDDIEDRPAACECPCHQPEGEAMSGAAPRPYVSRDTELADEIGLPWIAEVPFIDPSGAHLGWSSESFATHAEAFAYAVRNAPKEPEARSFAEEA